MLSLEQLERRDVPSALSIGDASAIEGSSALKFIDQFVSQGSGSLTTPRQSVFGPDGNLYVASAGTNAVLRYDGVTGVFRDVFVTSGSGGLNGPGDLVFSPPNANFPDGCLYVSGVATGQVLRYDGVSGKFLDVVASGLSNPLGLTLGSDGSLYIANQDTNEVLRANSSGLSVFVTAGSGGLNQPRKAVFGPDGNLYVASQGTEQVLRYNRATGAFIDVFANTYIGQGLALGPEWLQFGTDGYLYTTARYPTSGSSNGFLRFSATTGAFVDALVPNSNGWSFNLGAGNVVYDSGNAFGNFVNRYGPSLLAAFTVSLDSPSSTPITVAYSTGDGTALGGTDYVAASGTLTFTPGLMSQMILVQTLDDHVTGSTKSFTINLSNPMGATLARGQGTGTILEGDSTKFYVVDAASAASTYRYGISGNAFGTVALGSGDTAPRGVASNAAGTTIWVADANKNVYVYNPNGTLLGSWADGGLPGNAQLTGIATNGSDIWLVANSAGKVYKYSGAASRLSGTQSADNSFHLNNADSNPQDIVIDGTSLWVVDGSALKVFKYTLSGSLLGSWSIDPGNTHPTGITINSNIVSDIWIVDSGTRSVYQYTAAAGLTSGSQNASGIFAMAAGDTNPQGIADPPPPELLLMPPAFPLVAQHQSSIAAFDALSRLAPSSGAELPSLANRDLVFALQASDALSRSGVPSIDRTASDAVPALNSRHWFRSHHGAVRPWDIVLLDVESTALAINAQ
jgi:hypothetical protein